VALAALIASGWSSGVALPQPAPGTHPLEIGWDARDPYQFLDRAGGQEFLTGLDIEIVRAAARHSNLAISFESVGWAGALEGVRSGSRDAALGVFRLPDRETYGLFSDPYRVEQDSLFLRPDDVRDLQARSLPELFDELARRRFRLGVVEGYYYGPEFAAFAGAPGSAVLVSAVASDSENFARLADGSIDGFLADRLVGLRLSGLTARFSVRPHPVVVYTAPVHVMFSRAATDPRIVEQFNRGLATARTSGDYDRIVRRFTGPVLISAVTGTRWFFTLDVIGTIAFAISGVLIARKEGYSVFGAVVLAALPAVGGGIVRDLLIGRRPIGVVRGPLYLLLVLATVAVGFVVYFALDRARGRFLFMFDLSSWIVRMSRVVLPRDVFELFDALGLAAFTVTGVAIASSAGAEPLLLWGPICGALTGAGGGILRDVIRADAQNPALKTSLYAEIALVWAFLMSIFLQFQDLSSDPDHVRIAILATMTGVFVTRTVVIAKKLASPRF
jgi:polar amino acid transport system substrate-binding protein